MSDINYKKINESSLAGKILLAKEQNLLKALTISTKEQANLKQQVNCIYELYKAFKSSNIKSYKLKIEFSTEQNFKNFINFFQFTSGTKVRNEKGLNTIKSISISQSKIIPPLSLTIETFINHKDNIRYSKIYISLQK